MEKTKKILFGGVAFASFLLMISMLLVSAPFGQAMGGNNSSGNGTTEAFLYIENIFPAPYDPNTTFLGNLPTIPEPQLSELFDWNGQSPVSFQMMFEIGELEAHEIDSIAIFVNGKQIPQNAYSVSKVFDQTPTTLLSSIPNLFAGTADPDYRFKVDFRVPYRVDNSTLKTFMEVKLRVRYGDEQSETVKYVTLLNDPMLLEMLEGKAKRYR